MDIKDYGTEVILLAFTTPITEFAGEPRLQDAEGLIEFASRLCVDKVKGVGSRENYIKDRIAQGHESVVEHASATFYIKCSRVVTHELVRHRIASYSQRSQRYVRESVPQYFIPPDFSNDPEIAVEFIDLMARCWAVYSKALTAGLKPEIARYVLPNACETQITMTMNFRELRHFIKLRTSPRALPEMREVAEQIKSICKEIAPKVFEDL